MTWFGDRLSRRGATSDSASLEQHPLSREEPRSAGPEPEPALVLLATDAAGSAARRVHCFSEAQAAERFVEFWYPERRENSVLAYWLLAAKPDRRHGTDWGAKLLLMIRDGMRRGVVYAFSFTDIDDVRAFLADEMERSLNPESVLLFWSVPARIHADSAGRAVLFPSALPEGMAAGNHAVTSLAEKEMAANALRSR